MRTRGWRRKTDQAKGARKKKLCVSIYGFDFYKHDGQYIDGKIHCSCPLCAAKTNAKLNKSKGRVDELRRFCRLAMTNGRLGKKNYKVSERRSIMSMLDAMKEFGC